MLSKNAFILKASRRGRPSPLEALFFCDGGGEFGLGHVVRCHGLAEEFMENGYEVELVINGTATVDGLPYENMCGPQLWPNKAAGKLCVIDSYTISKNEIESIWRLAKSCLWIDDENLRAYPGGTVVNPSLYGSELEYNNPNVRYLLGADYIILRRAFRKQVQKTVNRNINELTITLGGTDANSLLLEISGNLSTLGCNKNIITGSQINLPGYNMLSRLQAEQMSEVFLRSDLVISAGGQTANELIQMNTPAILIEAADNQRNNIRAAVKKGLALTCKPEKILDTAAKMDYNTRAKLIAAMEKYDFSNGTKNIVNSL